MSPRPHDFDPAEEQEIYDIFSTLRREVYDAIKDLATQIFARIDLQQGEDERAEQPDMLQIIEHSLMNLLQIIIELFQGSPRAQLPDESDREEEVHPPDAKPPLIRRRPKPEQEDE